MQRVIALIITILLSPLFLLTGLLAAIGSGMPMIFIQERIGLNKATFTIYKFKSMRHGKVTRIGALLRKTGLDELPQLINIIEGNMKFVGPRPLTQQDIERLEWNDQTAKPRWEVHPGITGMAQLTTICNKDRSLKNDLYYAKNKSASLDLKILYKSTLIPFIGKANAKTLIKELSH